VSTQVSQYENGKNNLDYTEARDNEWQWHQLGHMQACTSPQTNNHASTPALSFYQPDALPASQPAASKHRRQKSTEVSSGCLYSRSTGWLMTDLPQRFATSYQQLNVFTTV